jgi:hypothetical protein|eukprot:COSAG01_NODE_2387_length_7782_cov_1207.598985_8_plen_115_part_00
MSFFSCDWILLIFLISRLQAEWRTAQTGESARSITAISMGSVLLPADRSSKATRAGHSDATVRCVEQVESHWVTGRTAQSSDRRPQWAERRGIRVAVVGGWLHMRWVVGAGAPV